MQVRHLLQNDQQDVKIIEGLRIGFYDHAGWRNNRAPQVDALVVSDVSAIHKIRRNDNLYLLPVFTHGIDEGNGEGSYDENNPYKIISKVKAINKSCEPFLTASLPDQEEERNLIKLLRFLITRSKKLKPILTRTSSIGYNFKELEMIMGCDPMQGHRKLKEYAESGHLSASLIDKANLCYECESSYVHFSECCTQCNSIDLKNEELIHHFRCAYIGPESDFKKGDYMTCPKCDHTLKHIGIDYDKPSEIHTCKSCSHASQETKMKATCIDCGKENELSQLTTIPIYEYTVTQSGHSYAEEPFQRTPVESVRKDQFDSVAMDYALYKFLKKHEENKKGVYNEDSWILHIELENSIRSSLSSIHFRSLVEELSTIVKPYLSPQDLLTIDKMDRIETLIINHSYPSVLNVSEIIEYNLSKMLVDNGWACKNPISIKVEKLVS